jgi:hypothetical protein
VLKLNVATRAAQEAGAGTEAGATAEAEAGATAPAEAAAEAVRQWQGQGQCTGKNLPAVRIGSVSCAFMSIRNTP